MYVCICRAVTDKEVESVIHEGAQSVADVTRACGAGGDCGSCQGEIEQMLDARCIERCAPNTRRVHLTLSPDRAA